MSKTMIDILNKGNLELFHSSIIAWLLDPEESHDLGAEFLHAFLNEAYRNRSEFCILDDLPYECSEVKTEVHGGRKKRYDICIDIGDKRFIVENKTKSLGEKGQLDTYKGNNQHVIALGLLQESFEKDVHEKYPLITYGTVKDLLKMVLDNTNVSDQKNNEYRVLIQHYYSYLDRELKAFGDIANVYLEGASHSLPDLYLTRRENDIRFYNYYYLHLLKNYRTTHSPMWFDKEENEWHEINKNMRSGVWYAFNSDAFKWDN
jgi:hypothetical protein